MNKLTELKEFYQNSLMPNLIKIEKKRTTILTRLIVLGAFLGVAFPAGAYFLVKQIADPTYLFYFIPLVALLAVGFYVIFESMIKNTSYYNAFKHNVISKLIGFINSSLHYDKKQLVSPKEYHNSQFFPKSDVHFTGDDHVSGTIDNVRIEFSELKATYKQKANRDAAGSKYQFRGIFFVAEAPRPFGADLLIESKRSGISDIKGTSYLPSNAKEFNELFQVYILTDAKADTVDAIINQDFMNRLINFNSQLHNEIHISFVYNKMYVGIRHEKDLFEPSLFDSVINFEKTLHYFHDLYYPISIIERFAAHKSVEAYSQTDTLGHL